MLHWRLSFCKLHPTPQDSCWAEEDWWRLPDRDNHPLEHFRCSRNVCVSSRSVPWHNVVSQVYRKFSQPHVFLFTLTCTSNWDIQWIWLCRGGPRSSYGTSRTIDRSMMQQRSRASGIAKRLSTYLLFYLLFIQNLCSRCVSESILMFTSMVWMLTKKSTMYHIYLYASQTLVGNRTSKMQLQGSCQQVDAAGKIRHEEGWENACMRKSEKFP